MTLVIDGEPPSISAARSRRPVAWPGIARDRVGGIGALGGEAIGSFVFPSGQALRFDVGGNGGGCATPDAPNGGTNGGGSGGSGCAGGGGGATDVRVGACAATATCGTSSAIIVAGGGGKATDNDEGQGGAGGGPNGANGTAGHNGAGTLGGGGQGATQSAGGPGGIGGVGSLFPNPSPSGGDGTTLQGGVGGHDGCSGGGGGGGVFGGGGGGSAGGGNGCGGGGGGSSFVSTSGTNVSFNSNVAGTLGGGVVTITFLYDTITTSKPSAPSVRTSTPVTDTVTVSRNGTDVPTGNISFNVCGPLTGPSECTSAAGTTVGSPVSLKANHDAGNTSSARSSASVSERIPGCYCFFASYPGDSNYNASADTLTALIANFPDFHPPVSDEIREGSAEGERSRYPPDPRPGNRIRGPSARPVLALADHAPVAATGSPLHQTRTLRQRDPRDRVADGSPASLARAQHGAALSLQRAPDG